ncbi:hypothetical protein [Mycobacterium lentiflavum]|uniref:hypothetical protein n=1 Tax=Mycobacterium lentiflavum TaxID=141349 RepID=UPI001FD0B23E|nr:hypothetical protein [Mycobacterium lentiflavum]
MTAAVFPETDAIRPRTRACPVAGDEVDVVAGDAAGLDEPGLDVFDEPHATTDAAVTPATASKANRASRDG